MRLFLHELLLPRLRCATRDCRRVPRRDPGLPPSLRAFRSDFDLRRQLSLSFSPSLRAPEAEAEAAGRPGRFLNYLFPFLFFEF